MMKSVLQSSLGLLSLLTTSCVVSSVEPGSWNQSGPSEWSREVTGASQMIALPGCEGAVASVERRYTTNDVFYLSATGAVTRIGRGLAEHTVGFDLARNRMAFAKDEEIEILDFSSGQVLETVRIPNMDFDPRLGAVFFSKDGAYLYAILFSGSQSRGGASQRFRYSFTTGAVDSLPGHNDKFDVLPLGLTSPSGRLEATTTTDPDIVWLGRDTKWNISTGEIDAGSYYSDQLSWQKLGIVDAVGDSRGDGIWILTDGGIAHVTEKGIVDRSAKSDRYWPTGFRSLSPVTSYNVGYLALSADGLRAAYVEKYHSTSDEYISFFNSIVVWDLATLTVIKRLNHPLWSVGDSYSSRQVSVVFDGVDSRVLYTLLDESVLCWRVE